MNINLPQIIEDFKCIKYIDYNTKEFDFNKQLGVSYEYKYKLENITIYIYNPYDNKQTPSNENLLNEFNKAMRDIEYVYTLHGHNIINLTTPRTFFQLGDDYYPDILNKYYLLIKDNEELESSVFLWRNENNIIKIRYGVPKNYTDRKFYNLLLYMINKFKT